ncbi:phytanoyl-CoA dioxygenase family protein [Sphingomonas sp. KR3-1]|uniref:phytanoyl-CoA dioxygenase family protein n=1 Tax=Sphingomonas sp. KR3-1 TaxID=3156611 RepID=UPI0032B589CB
MAKLDYIVNPFWGFHGIRHMALLRLRDPGKRAAVGRFLARMKPAKIEAGQEALQQAGELQRDGFVMLPGAYSTELLTGVRDKLLARECFDPYHPERGTFALDDAPAEANVVNVLEPETIPEVIQIANDPAVLQVVSEYLGCRPLINDLEAWWSLPDRPAPREAQNFHRDNDAIRFVKLFIYLTDVGDADGPHMFVKGSHRSQKLLAEGVRLTDAEVEAAHDADEIMRFTGPFGTTFLEDTFGIHKGELPKANRRLILQVRYTLIPSCFVKKGTLKADPTGYDPYVNHWIKARG